MKHRTTVDNEPKRTEWRKEVFLPRAPGDMSQTNQPETHRTQVRVIILINTEAQARGKGVRQTKTIYCQH